MGIRQHNAMIREYASRLLYAERCEAVETLARPSDVRRIDVFGSALQPLSIEKSFQNRIRGPMLNARFLSEFKAITLGSRICGQQGQKLQRLRRDTGRGRHGRHRSLRDKSS